MALQLRSLCISARDGTAKPDPDAGRCKRGSAYRAALQDGLIHRDEFALALFKSEGQSNIFTDKVFQVFDIKQNDVVDFDEFIRSLSVFHPKAPLTEKADCALPAVSITGHRQYSSYPAPWHSCNVCTLLDCPQRQRIYQVLFGKAQR